MWRQVMPDDYACVTPGEQAGIGDCSQVPNTTNNGYAIAYDTVSGRWSNRVPVDSSCASR